MELFLGGYDKDFEVKEYRLTVCKRNTEPLFELSDLVSFSYDERFAQVDEISFSVSAFMQDTGHNRVPNPIYNEIRGDYLILLEKPIGAPQYFIINDISEKDDSGVKEIHAFSREYELADKIIRGYDLTNRKLYDTSNSKDPQGFENGVLNYIETLTTWRVDTVNLGGSAFDISQQERDIGFSETNIINALQELQGIYDCLFTFDTVERKIRIVDPYTTSQHSGLAISDKNFLSSLTKNIKHDEVKTRLYVYGANNVSIEPYTITGQPYLEDFSFYRNLTYMSQDLLDALDTYDAFVETKSGQFSTMLDEMLALNATKADILVELDRVTKLTRVNEIKLDLDITVRAESEDPESTPFEISVADFISDLEESLAQGEEISQEVLDYLNNLGQAAMLKRAELWHVRGLLALELQAVESQLSNINLDIANKRAEMGILQEELRDARHFSDTLMAELDPFIKDEVYTDDAYPEVLMGELYEAAKKKIVMISQPRIEFDTSLVDFLSLVEGQHVAPLAQRGSVVTLEHEELGINIDVKLVEKNHSPLAGDLTFRFSNRNNYNDPYTYERDLLSELQASSATVDFSKHGWTKGKEAASIISDRVDENLNIVSGVIRNAANQKNIVDERGFWLYKDTNGEIDANQMRIINNALALTTDNWESVSTAITPLGINAQVIRGKIGEFAKINSHQIDVSPATEAGGLNDFNGISINSTDGFVATKGDNLIRTIINATEGISIQKKDGSDWSPVFFADGEGNITFKGHLQGASGTFTGALEGGTIKIGSDNNVFKADGSGIYLGNDAFGNAPFRVSIEGNLIANNASLNDVSLNDATLTGNINMSGGKISWSPESSPVKAQYSVTSSGPWSDTYNSSHFFVHYSYDGGESYTAPIRINAVDGQNGQDGSDADVPDYIKETFIDFNYIKTPTVFANHFYARTAFHLVSSIIQDSENGTVTVPEGSHVGYMGLGYGNQDGDLTIGVAMGAGDYSPSDGGGNYFIATNAGIRMQYQHAGITHSIYMDSGGAWYQPDGGGNRVPIGSAVAVFG